MTAARDIEAFYRVFQDISTSVHSSTDVNEVLDLIVRATTEAIGAKGALLRILNLATKQMELSAAYGLSERYLSKGHVSSQKMITDLCKQNKVIIIDDVHSNPRVQYPKAASEEGIRMILDVPLFLGSDVVGIIRIYLSQPRTFSQEEQKFLVSIAEQCAVALDKARLIEKQQSMYDHLAMQTEKMSSLGRMAAGIAHEINNPLAAILIYATNMAKKVPSDSSLKEGLDVIIDEAVRCRRVIKDLLEFSRHEKPQAEEASLNKVIEKTLRIMENEFRLHHITVEQALADDLPDILMGENQIQQLLVNLLINAVEAMDSTRPRYAPVVSLVYQGYKPKEIGKILGVKSNTIRARMAKIRKEVKAHQA